MTRPVVDASTSTSHTPTVVTREQAIDEAAEVFAQAIRLRDSLPVEEAARLAYTPTGPSLPELEDMIRAQRAGRGSRGNGH